MKGKGLLKVLFVVLVVGVLAMAAWFGVGRLLAESAADEGAGAPQVSDLESLIEALREAGFEVETLGAIEDPLFAGEGEALEVDGQYVQVFSFESEAAAQEAADTVQGGGTIIGLATVDWVEPPHFYLKGALLALYAGSDEALIGALNSALGEPFLIGFSMGLPAPGGEAGE